jgi:hypothetical protein
MAAWAPSRRQPAPPVAQPAEPPVGTAVVERRRPRISRPHTQKVTARHFADPFADDDGGANCIRCGHLVQRVREKRGLTTCSQCG